jgi:hypothetical protein
VLNFRRRAQNYDHRQALAPWKKVCALEKNLRLGKKFAPWKKVCASEIRLRLGKKFVLQKSVCAYRNPFLPMHARRHEL